MGENEQGGMLRTVVVIGLVALIAAVITLGIIGLKSNMTKNTDNAVGTVVTTKKPYYSKDINFKDYTPSEYAWDGPRYRLPYIGDVPPNNWRDIMIKLTVHDNDVFINYDVNNYLTNSGTNDNDDASKRFFEIRNASTNEVVVKNATGKLNAGSSYIVTLRYFNNKDEVLRDSHNAGSRTSLNMTATDSHSPISVKVDSVEAATYDDKYLHLDD